jgi:hypothetical protein
MNTGPTGRALPGTDPEIRAAVRDRLTTMLAAHLGPDGVLLPGSAWVVVARR